MNKMFFIFCILFFMVYSIYTQDTETIVNNRKIVVIPFYNTADGEFDYLSMAINDSITVSLKETGIYDLVDYKIIDNIIKKNKINIDTFIWEDTSVKVADLTDADVVLFGFYTVNNDKITIFFNALDSEVRRSAVKVEKTGDMGITVIETINQAVSEFKDLLKEKLPPLEKKKNMSSIALLDITADESLHIEKEKFTEIFTDYVNKNEGYSFIPQEKVLSTIRDLQISNLTALSAEEIFTLGKELETDVVLTGTIMKDRNEYKLELFGYDTNNAEKVISKILTFRKSQISKNAEFAGYYVVNYKKMNDSNISDEEFIKMALEFDKNSEISDNGDTRYKAFDRKNDTNEKYWRRHFISFGLGVGVSFFKGVYSSESNSIDDYDDANIAEGEYINFYYELFFEGIGSGIALDWGYVYGVNRYFGIGVGLWGYLPIVPMNMNYNTYITGDSGSYWDGKDLDEYTDRYMREFVNSYFKDGYTAGIMELSGGALLLKMMIGDLKTRKIAFLFDIGAGWLFVVKAGFYIRGFSFKVGYHLPGTVTIWDTDYAGNVLFELGITLNYAKPLWIKN